MGGGEHRLVELGRRCVRRARHSNAVPPASATACKEAEKAETEKKEAAEAQAVAEAEEERKRKPPPKPKKATRWWQWPIEQLRKAG